MFAPARFSLLFLLIGLLLSAAPGRPAAAQAPYDGSWYDPDQPHVKIGVAEDGVYRVSGADLQAAGVSTQTIDPASLRLLENGREIPIHYDGAPDGFGASDGIVFVGRRNRGTGELWAYRNDNAALQSSPFRSLYTDTTTYWLTWGGAQNGLRYETVSGGGAAQNTVRDTLHLEEDNLYYYGDPVRAGSPLYTRGEGYYWQTFSHLGGDPEPVARTYDVPLGRLAPEADAPVALSVRVNGQTASRHRLTLEVETAAGFTEMDVADWQGYAFQTLRAEIPAADVPADGTLRIRVTSSNEFGGNPNKVLLDFIEAAYTRTLTAENGAQHFAVPGGVYTFELGGYDASAPVRVFVPKTGERFALTASAGGAATFSASAPAGGAVFWAAQPDAFRAPASLVRDQSSSWADASNAADYVILTTRALRPSAEALADFRRNQNGFAVVVVEVENVFDEFDYGRPTPLAIRRFVHRTQSWATAPTLMAIWADAAFPVRTETEATGAPWNVPAFGYAPSDAWYAMQFEGPEDWSEVVGIGRVTIRTNAQGLLFLQKLQIYEASGVAAWQKRALMLSGGTSAREQNRLEAFTRTWAATAAGRPTGMDTLYFAKQSDAPLDQGFQDSLSVAFARGAGWLNYFGHSSAQTWEIVTEEPAEFDNADRLPFVVSLGCQTGSFAGGRFASKDAPSFGEKLILGYDSDGNTSLNGAIAHFGTSYQGNLTASADINDLLIERVFEDTLRVMGQAVQEAKAEIAERFGRSTLYRDHLMQYNLLGDPAATLAIATEPDLRLSPAQLRFTPLAPTPSDSLALQVRLANDGLFPTDSFAVRLTRQAPGGPEITETRRLAPFALEETIRFASLLTDENVGTNTFRVETDPLSEVAEADETNNAASAEQTVFSTGLQIVAPQDFGIVTEATPTLRLSLSAVDEEAPEVEIALSESADFATTLASTRQGAEGLLVEWQPSAPLTDGQTYFWRARVADAGAAWTEASFTVRLDLASEGFLQQGAQFDANTQARLLRQGDESENEWAFAEYRAEVLATSERGAGAFKGQFNVGGAQRYEYLGLGFGVLIIDGATGAVKASASLCTYDVTDSSFLNGRQCSFRVDGEGAVAKLDSLIGTLEEGDYLFTRTRHLGRRGGPEIPQAVQDAFRTLGGGAGGSYSQAIDTLTYNDLWIMHARKGFPEETTERVAPAGNGENEITYESLLAFRYAEGTTLTPRIGPAQRWGELDFTARTPDPADRLRVDVLSGDAQTVLRENLAPAEAPFALGAISAREHPFLRLRATFADPEGRTAPQLDEWRLTYAPTAEIALDARRLTLPDTLQEGERTAVSVPVVNLSRTAADTVLVSYLVTDAQNQTRTVDEDTLLGLAPGAEEIARAQLSTDGLAGENVLSIRAEQPQRPEPIAFNNTLVRRFFVGADEAPPGFRVLVDGRPLPSDPEPLVNLQDPALPFVSARPTFEIEIEDEGGVSALDDPSAVTIYLDCDPRRPTSSCEAVPAADTTFHPAEAAGEAARVFYEPDLTGRDTTHTLRVAIRDDAGNPAGGEDIAYQLHFRVQARQAVADLYPYPNPMATHTTFAFRVEGGASAPRGEDLRLRIYTIAGRLIYEMDGHEANDGSGLRVGWNTLFWDGRDQSGDRVATGIYLYTVRMKDEDGAAMDVNDGGVEKIAVIR